MTSNVIITVKLSYFRQKKKIKENFKVYCTTKKKRDWHIPGQLFSRRKGGAGMGQI